LTFEFTEDERVTDHRHLLNIIAEHRRHGFKTAMDDFGMSYSSLSRMADLRPDIIKLDRYFVKALETDKMRQAILACVVRMGTEVGIKVVAEGFERPEEIDAARAVGVRFMQGFYFGIPMFEAIAGENDIVWPVSPDMNALPPVTLAAPGIWNGIHDRRRRQRRQPPHPARQAPSVPAADRDIEAEVVVPSP